MFREGTFFEQVVANAFVGRKQNPAHRTYQGQPSLISSSARKVSEMALEADDKPCECFLKCTGIAEVFVRYKTKSSGGDGECAFPADGLFDLLRRAAIFLGQSRDGLACVETRGDYSSRDTRLSDNGLAKADQRIDLDGLWFGWARLDDKGKKAEEAVRIGFHSLQMHSVKIQIQLIRSLRNVNGLPHSLDKKVLAVRQENFAD